MDAEAKKKLFRAKLKAQKQEKQRIDSPLVRYNEHDQLVCKVCDVVIKSDSLWPAHQVSRKHHEAIDKLKANASALNRANNSKHQPPKELPKPKSESYTELHDKSESSTALPKQRSSMLPPNFFDNHETKRQKKGNFFFLLNLLTLLVSCRRTVSESVSYFLDKDSGKLEGPNSHNGDSISAKIQVVDPIVSGSGADISPSAKSVDTRDPEYQASKESRQLPKKDVDSEAKQVKGSIPQGFFDDKDADLRARGITLVKPDVKDEYKEFEKLIQEDLREVDDRLEEEEIDAAETIEEAESVEQRTYRERVELLRKKKLELRASKSAVCAKVIEVSRKESSHEDSSSDDEDSENSTVDWRAKHF
ncbi:hypothetical protein ACJIZ3_023308 [Penstemon smallii]|uniref:Zinc finger protein 830 n=1 Tax=Penstemon smallii TaxID=265156 RepID=A0ABD3TR06_9LAMI